MPQKANIKRGLLVEEEKLAEERTELANQRTLLAFIRTFLTMVVVGVSLLKFFEPKIIHMIGWGLIIAGIFTLVIGIYDYSQTKHFIRIFEKYFPK